MQDEDRGRVYRHVQEVFSRPGSHGLDHVLRVTALCERIGTGEHADMDILIPAALFHDIARPTETDGSPPHEETGARMAEEYFRSIGYDEDRIAKICHAILTHRFRTERKPDTLEAKILSDADKLDAMGAVGIARTFLRAGEHHGQIADGIDHMHEKLLRLSGRMYTPTARKLAVERHRFLEQFIRALEDETGREDRPGRGQADEI